MNLKLLTQELASIAFGTVAISVAYLRVLPRLLEGQKTYSVLIFGLAVVAFVSGYFAYKGGDSARPVSWILVLAVSVASTLVTLVMSLFLITNIRGS